MKLDLLESNKYVFPIEARVLPVNEGQYHMEQIGAHGEKMDVTKRHHHIDGTCDVYAIVEAGEEYLVHTPEKSQQVRIAEGGDVHIIETQYWKHA